MSDILAGSVLIQATGTALLAFLWQGAAIGVVAIAAAALSRRARRTRDISRVRRAGRPGARAGHHGRASSR